MNRPQNRWMIAATCLVLLSVVVTLQGQEAKKARPTAAAVVDVQAVVNKMAERNAIDADLVRIKENLDKEMSAKADEIKAIQADLGILAADSPTYAETENSLFEKMAYLQAWQKLQSDKFEQERALRMESMYNKIIQAVERLAVKGGYDLVLYKDQTEPARGKSQQQVATIITLRKVLYSAPDLDITDDVIQLLNNEFNK